MNASSTCAFSAPVWRHWAMNRGWDRLAIALIVSSDSGHGDQRRRAASSGEIEIIMMTHADDREQRREQLAQRLLQALGDVVDVVGDAAEQVAARLAVDVAERQPVELVLDVGAQPVHRALHDAGEHVGLQRTTARPTPT